MPNTNQISFVHLGNTYIPNSLASHKSEGFLRVLELLGKSDVAVANLECTIHDGNDWPAFGGGMGWAGTYMPMPPSMIDELKHVGINAVYCANNHTADFGEGGILTAVKYLKQKDMALSGIGASLTEASAPCYIETQGGTVAIISVADWTTRLLMELPFPWPAGYMPSDELPPFKSRPGVNLIRYDVVVHVDQAAFDQLRRISGMLQWERGKVGRRTGGVRTETLGRPFPSGLRTGQRQRILLHGQEVRAGRRLPHQHVRFSRGPGSVLPLPRRRRQLRIAVDELANGIERAVVRLTAISAGHWRSTPVGTLSLVQGG